MCRDRWRPALVMDRAVVASDDRSTRILIYRNGIEHAIVQLSDDEVLHLAGSLIDAARRRLPPSPIVVHIDPALAKV